MTTEQRKADHIDLCLHDQVEYVAKTTLLDDVELLHDSLPELDWDELDTSVDALGRKLRAPFVISGMTGGTEQATTINRTLATVAQEFGLAFGVGSQRAMRDDPSLGATYTVRDVAPDILLFGNIGAVQAAGMTTDETASLVDAIGADALCIHLNPGQELFQPEGDRDFRGCLDAIARLSTELTVPVIVKETGCGLSHRTLDRIANIGVQWVDVSGAGGTTWIGVEARRAESSREIGEVFWEWGVPTAASIQWANRRQLRVIGSGGLRTGLDAAKAIALGATLAGMALPWLKSAANDGHEGATSTAQRLIRELKTAMLLTGSPDLAALRSAPRLIGARLERWLSAAPR